MSISLDQPPKPSGGRISRLFVRGKTVQIGKDEQGPVFIWVQALTRTQQEEASIAGLVALQRQRLTFRPGNPDFDLLKTQMDSEVTDDDLIDGIIGVKHMNTIWHDAELDLHADVKWRDSGNLDLIRQSDAQLKSGDIPSPEESEALADLNLEYMTDWQNYAAARLEAKRSELRDLSRAELEDLYVDAAVSLKTLKAQVREYNIVAVYYALRICSATLDANEQHDHSTCDGHRRQYFTDIEEVRSAPDELSDAVIAALADLDSAADVLGGSGPQAA